MTRRLLVIAAGLLLGAQAPGPTAPGQAAPVPATPASAPAAVSAQSTAAPPSNGWVARSTADIQVLDKVNAHATTLTLKVGQAADNASLSITLRACQVRPPDLPPDSTAFLDIDDHRPGAPGFHGWMFAKEPSLSMLENPIYDVRLVDCH